MAESSSSNIPRMNVHVAPRSSAESICPSTELLGQSNKLEAIALVIKPTGLTLFMEASPPSSFGPTMSYRPYSVAAEQKASVTFDEKGERKV